MLSVSLVVDYTRSIECAGFGVKFDQTAVGLLWMTSTRAFVKTFTGGSCWTLLKTDCQVLQSVVSSGGGKYF